MKVSHRKDSVDLQNVQRSNRSKKSEAVNNKEILETNNTGSSEDAANVSLSKDAKILAKGIQTAKNSDVSDKEKIARIKEKLQQGTYEPDYGILADKMLDDHSDF